MKRLKILADSEGKIVPDKLSGRILESLNSDELDYFIQETQSKIFAFCDLVKQYPNDLGTGWSSESRIACLDHLSSTPPKENNWDKLVWLSDVYQCVASRKSLFNNSSSKKPSIFPRGNLPPNSENWERGINNLGRKVSYLSQ